MTASLDDMYEEMLRGEFSSGGKHRRSTRSGVARRRG